MSGSSNLQAPSIINGHVYLATGNSGLPAVTVTPGPSGTFTGTFFDGTVRVDDSLNAVADYFIAGDALKRGGNDFGASGVVYAEDQGVILQGTKGAGGTAALYVLDPNNLGKYTLAPALLTGPTDGGAKQRVPLATGELRGNPAYWPAGGGRTSSSLFVHPEKNPLRKYTLAGGKLTLATSGPAASVFADGTPPTFGTGFSTVVSAAAVNAAQGLVWDLDDGSVDGPLLYAYDADDLTPVATLGSGCSKPTEALFTIPAVAGGHVFVACSNTVAVYGLTKVRGGLQPKCSACLLGVGQLACSSALSRLFVKNSHVLLLGFWQAGACQGKRSCLAASAGWRCPWSSCS